ncbi:MAG: hypothetical protein CL680_21390 [Blastomonas sp.]|nr:hypothetical protein [Blastomonas sp.]
MLILLFELIVGVPIFVLSCFLAVELIVGVISYREFENTTTLPSNDSHNIKSAILIPAHNEEDTIGETLAQLNSHKTENDVVVVVADNCTDNTRMICESFGVYVTERFNDVKKGKGYALQHGKDWVCENLDVDVVIIFDADCFFTDDSLERLKKITYDRKQVCQARYLMQSKHSSPKTLVPQFTWWVKNAIRAVGLKVLARTAHIQGSGIAFPIDIFKGLEFASGSIVEDLELGINLSLTGKPVHFCQEAQVESYFPENQKGLDEQRNRWEHGHLATIIRVPAQLLNCVFRRDLRSFFLLLDAAVPPLISFFLLQATFCMVGTMLVVYWMQGVLLSLSASSFLITFSTLFLVWFVRGKALIGLSDIPKMIKFLTSKFSVYSRLVSGRKASWDKTTRDKM